MISYKYFTLAEWEMIAESHFAEKAFLSKNELSSDSCLGNW